MFTRHRQVVGEGYTDPWFKVGSGDIRGAGYLSPDLERPSSGHAVIVGIGVGRTAEEVCHLIMSGQEALCLPG